MMLYLHDAVKVAKDFMEDMGLEIDIDSEALLWNEMEQKCWIVPHDNPALEALTDTFNEVHIHAICEHIQKGDLVEWCEEMEATMNHLLQEVLDAEKK